MSFTINGIVLQIVKNGDYTYHTIKCDESPFFTKPGQYIEICTEQQKCFMAVVKQKNYEIHVLAPANTFASNLLNVNTQLKISKPKGGFDCSNIEQNEIVCIATGSGISAIIPVITLASEQRIKSHVFYIESHRQHFKFDINEQFANLKLLKSAGVLSNSDDITLGLKLIGCDIINFKKLPIFVCGNNQFINKLKQQQLTVRTNYE